jgi:hypothetical protein
VVRLDRLVWVVRAGWFDLRAVESMLNTHLCSARCNINIQCIYIYIFILYFVGRPRNEVMGSTKHYEICCE